MHNKHLYFVLFILIFAVTVSGILTVAFTHAARVCAPEYKWSFLPFSGIGNRIPYQLFVTPEDENVKETASALSNSEEAYELSVNWIYVTEQRLNGTDEKWLTPGEFLSATPDNPRNPVPGEIAGDCEEQACTLVSLLRAMGVPADEVRVVLGTTGRENDSRGHAWVELWHGADWLTLDPSCGPYWDNDREILIDIQGLPFDFYAECSYPVPDIDIYYNDIYYLDTGSGLGNAPEWWLEQAEMTDSISPGFASRAYGR
jgi:hypothetical protein